MNRVYTVSIENNVYETKRSVESHLSIPNISKNWRKLEKQRSILTLHTFCVNMELNGFHKIHNLQ